MIEAYFVLAFRDSEYLPDSYYRGGNKMAKRYSKEFKRRYIRMLKLDWKAKNGQDMTKADEFKVAKEALRSLRDNWLGEVSDFAYSEINPELPRKRCIHYKLRNRMAKNLLTPRPFPSERQAQ
jgi:hypothetical protein